LEELATSRTTKAPSTNRSTASVTTGAEIVVSVITLSKYFSDKTLTGIESREVFVFGGTTMGCDPCWRSKTPLVIAQSNPFFNFSFVETR